MRYFAALSMTRAGARNLRLCHAERSEAQSKHLSILASHLGLLYHRLGVNSTSQRVRFSAEIHWPIWMRSMA